MLAEKQRTLHPKDRLRRAQAPVEPEVVKNEKYLKRQS